MSHALVIKNVNFATNKVANISFVDPVPCTGISLALDTVSITDYDPVTLEYTVTPSDTTDPIEWATSDDRVVSVSNGELTVVGIGSCTVTVTCGDFSDSATVTVSLSCTPIWYGAVVSVSSEHNCITGGNSVNRVTAFGSGAQATTCVYAPTDSNPGRSAIKLPENTAAIKISITAENVSAFANDTYTKVYWTKDESAGWSSYPNAIKAVSSENAYNIRSASNYVKTYAVPNGADSFYLATKIADTIVSGQDYTADIEATGLTIEFLQSSELT